MVENYAALIHHPVPKVGFHIPHIPQITSQINHMDMCNRVTQSHKSCSHWRSMQSIHQVDMSNLSAVVGEVVVKKHNKPKLHKNLTRLKQNKRILSATKSCKCDRNHIEGTRTMRAQPTHEL